MNRVCSLRVDGVHVWRGDRHVLRNVSFDVSDGELVHVVGNNGAGKTTLLRTLAGLVTPEEGEVLWFGRSIRQQRAEYHARLAYSGHEPALKADLTSFENLRFSTLIRRRIDDAEILDCARRADTEAYAHLPARVLSAGQRRRSSLARTLAAGAALWLLDEPFSNLDRSGVELVNALIAEHLGTGGAAIVVAHQNTLAQTAATRLDLDS